MQVKRLFITITVLFSLLIPSVVQAQQAERPIVRLIYFLPSDREPQPGIDEKMDKLIKDMQRVYADLMERHGFGRKTFQFETDTRGNAVVHHVTGRFTERYYSTLSSTEFWEEIWGEFWGGIEGRFDASKNIYLAVIDISSEGVPVAGTCGGIGTAIGTFGEGAALIRAFDRCHRSSVTAHDERSRVALAAHDERSRVALAAHELAHAFGLLHDRRGDAKRFQTHILSDWMVTSFCAAEWLDAHRAFNTDQSNFNKHPTIQMLPLSFAAPPNAIRFRFNVRDPDGLHQVQLHGQSLSMSDLLGCKRLNGTSNHTVEFVTPHLGSNSRTVSLRMIDTHGNIFQSQSYPINVPSLLPRAKAVSIPDANLAAAVRREIGNSITTHTMLNLILHFNVPNRGITDITGLEHAHNLTSLNLGNIDGVSPVNSNAVSDISSLSGLKQLSLLDLSNNGISDVSLLADLKQLGTLKLGGNPISDVSPLSNLAQLWWLDLSNNGISDVSPLAGFTQLRKLNLNNNAISDVSPLVGLNLTGSRWDLTELYIGGNPLNYASINTHIPAMQAKGVEVKFTPRTPTTLVKISGTAQQGVVNTALPLPFIVEVRDQLYRAFAGVPVTFHATTGGGQLSATTVTTDHNGRAQTHLTLGRTPGTNAVRVTAAEISEPAQFTARGTRLTAPVPIPDINLRTQIVSALGKPPEHSITMADMLSLTELTANNANIRGLTGLQWASNLTTLSLNDNNIFDISFLAGLPKLTRLSLNANNISDVAPLSALTQCKTLSLDDNIISDVAPLAALTELQTLSLNNNIISDVAPLEALAQLKTLHLRGNLLSYPSLHTHIPAIQAGGTTVVVDTRTPTTLVKVSGTHGVTGTSLPLIAEVQDEKGFGFAGVPVTFSVTAGGGSLSASKVITDRTGRTRTTLTLGATPGENTVRATAVETARTTTFTLTAIDANSRVTIRDANLRAKIAETLSKPQGVQLTAGDMLALTHLDAPNTNIQNLTGLEHAHNLQYLNLKGEYIQGKRVVNSDAVSDFSPLFGLAQLMSLQLDYNALSDVAFLSQLPQLTSLSLLGNPISDISALAELTQLNSLYFNGAAISDISALAGLTQLTILGFWGTSVSDISALARLTQLEYLYLNNNAIVYVESLAALTRLGNLRLSGNAVTDVSPLAGLTQLRQLQLGDNPLTDVSALAGLPQLKYLYLSNTAVSDVSPLETLTQLTVLDLGYNTISDMSPLVELNLTGVKWDSTGLFLQGNPLNYDSIHTHIPAIQAKGIQVKFDPRTYPALDIVSGTGQQAAGGEALANPFVVAAIDARGTPMRGVSVTFTATQGNGELSTPTATTDARGRAETTFTLGPDPGKHYVRATAPGLGSPVPFIAIATAAAQLIADVNGDGVVNIQDLVVVSSRLGQAGQNEADVNGDGAVNIQDLVLVAGELGTAAAAPAAWHHTSVGVPSREKVEQWLTQAHRLHLIDIRSQRGVLLLERLLAALAPNETALLPNYPNPFNPETWIPYQLAEPAEVTLHIYSVTGKLVRTLALGHQPAGIYHNKNRAAYWDGRNEQGERVASGVYFYTLSAGDFSATRKILIRK